MAATTNTTDAAAHLSALMTQIEAYGNTIGEAQARVAEETRAFAHHFTDTAWTEMHISLQVDDAVHTLEESGKTVVESFLHKLEPAIAEGQAALDDFAKTLSAQAVHWHSLSGQVDSDIAGWIASLTAQEQHVGTILTQFGHEIEEAGKTLDHAAADLGTEFTHWNERIAALKDHLAANAQAFITRIVQEETQHLTALVGEHKGWLEHLLHGFTAEVGQVLADLGNQGERAMHQLADHVGSEVQQRLQQAVQDVIHTAIEEMLASITASLAASEIGSQVTSAMSPVLPYLIAINKAVDIILEAIRIWKSTIGELGRIFGG